MNEEEWRRRMAIAAPHGPDEPCTCRGWTIHHEKCFCYPGQVPGCTCDIDWDTMAELSRDGWTD